MDKMMEKKTLERETEERRNETTNDQQVFHLVFTFDHTSGEKGGKHANKNCFYIFRCGTNISTSKNFFT